MGVELHSQAIRRVAENFEAKTFERGLRYAKEGRVNLVRSEAWPVVAQVRGREGYVVTVHYTPESEHLWGECSCPVGHSCKHAAATALVAMSLAGDALEKRERHDSERAVGEWLARLGQLAVSEDTPAASSGTRAVLFDLQERNGELVVLIQQCTRRRDGRLGKASGLYFGVRHGMSVPSWVGDEGRRLVHRLWLESGVEEGLNPIRVRHLGIDALEALCQSGHFFVDGDRTRPLRVGAPRRESLRWAEDEEGSRLRLDEHLQLLPCAEPLYLDREEGILGPLDTGLDRDLLYQLELGPPVPAEMVEVVERSLASLVQGERSEAGLPHSVEPEPAPPMRPHIAVRLIRDDEDLEQIDVELSAHYGDDHFPLGEWAPERPGVRDLVAEGRALRDYERLSETKCIGFATTARELLDEARVAATELIPQLVDRGWSYELDEAVPADAPLMQVEIFESLQPIAASGFYFDFELGVIIRGRKVTLLPLLLDGIRKGLLDIDRTALLDGTMQGVNLELPTGELVRVSGERLQRWLRPLVELRLGGLTDEGQLLVPASVAADLARLEPDRYMSVADYQRLETALQPLLELTGRSAGSDFGGELRPYQELGHQWLRFHHDGGMGGVLADEMGLGKTVQVLAFLDGLRASRKLSKSKPALVVAPRSVVGNWAAEAARFAPKLVVETHLGPKRVKSKSALQKAHLVLSSYQTMLRDAELFQSLELTTLVLDESQAIKNPDTKLRRACARMNASSRFCMTGTPMENHLGELWSQFDLVMPGLLGTRSDFHSFRTAIEKNGMEEVLEILQRRLRPFMLRRKKSEVAIDLPPKSTMIESVPLDASQRDLYESVRLSVDKDVQKALSDRGVTGSSFAILEALLRLRQVCCDPRLLKIPEARKVAVSAKLERLLAMLEELADNGRHVLVFSQFTSMLALIQTELDAMGLPYVTLTGSTRDREQVVRRFQEGEVPVFLISLKAGGVGLNLTRADTVIHYDPWWNPAAEAQATDRAHRIGQDKPVFVYKLVAEGTLEERICELQREKAKLSEAALQKGGVRHLGAEDLASLYSDLI